MLIKTFLVITLAISTNQFASSISCSTSQFYNYLSHSCQSCPYSNMNPSSNDIAYCNCSSSHYPNPYSIGFNNQQSCLPLASGTTSAGTIALVFNKNGTMQTSVSSLQCGNSYPNNDKTACISCGLNKVYSPTLKMCICQNNYYPVNGICLTGLPSNSVVFNDLLSQTLYGISSLGCLASNPSKQSCQILLNQCASNGYSGDFCSLVSQKVSANAMQSYIASASDQNQSIDIYASSVSGTSSTDVKNKLTFTLLQYNKFGQLTDIKPINSQFLPCISTQEDAIHFQSFGLNLFKNCLPSDLQANTESYYDVYVLNSKDQYVQVFTIYSTGNYFKRYYKNGYNSIDMSYKSVPPLLAPYITLSTNNNPQISTTSTTDTINIVVTAPFIIFNVLVLVAFIINFYKYMKYNPYDDQNDPYIMFKVIFIFFLKAIRHWGIALWIWLFGVSAYCFCFFKFQQTVYLLLPDIVTQWIGYYDPFMIVFYVQFGFVLISVFLLIYDLSTVTDYFLIDWEKQKNLSNFNIHTIGTKSQISIWRKILLVNQLYELTVGQIVNYPFMILFGIVFLQGLKWINLSYQIPNTQNLQSDFSISSKKNVVLAYFIITFIFFIISTVQYILRIATKTWNPMPYENFVDLCCISNISLIIFDHQRHGYYLHGMNPLGQAEGSLGYIQSIFQKQAKSFGKSRAFKNNDPDQTQIFQIIFPRQIRHVFQVSYKTRYLQKLVGRAQDTSILTKPISHNLQKQDYQELEMIENDMVKSFKYYLEGIKISQFNVREQSFLQRLLSCPIDSDELKDLPIFFKDYWHKFTQILLSGHEFTLLINLINFINIFYIATGSVVIACLITMIINRLIIKNVADFFIKRNISRNTFIDDKFFN